MEKVEIELTEEQFAAFARLGGYEWLLRKCRPKRATRELAIGWLRGRLSADRVGSLEIRMAASAAGITEGTLWRAKSDLGIESIREGWGPGSRCYWSLPGEDV